MRRVTARGRGSGSHARPGPSPVPARGGASLVRLPCGVHVVCGGGGAGRDGGEPGAGAEAPGFDGKRRGACMRAGARALGQGPRARVHFWRRVRS